MSWQEALDYLAGHSHHRRYCELCAEDNPDVKQRDAYRALIIRTAAGDANRIIAQVEAMEAQARPGGGCGACP